MIRKKRARVRNLRKQEAERAFAAKKAAATKVEIAAENTTDVQLKPANLEQSPHAGSKIFSTIINDLKPMAMLNPHDPYWHKTQQHSKKVRGSTNTNTCLCGLNICAGGYESADHCAAMLTAGQRYGLPKRAQVRKSSRSALHNNHDILAILSPALKRVEKRPNFRILTFPGFVKPYGGMPSKLGPVNGSLKPHYVPDTTNLYPHTHPEYATLVQVKGEASGDQQPTSKRAGIPLTPLTGCLVTGAWKSNGVGITNFGRLTFTTASSTDRYKPSTAKKAPPLNHVENRNSSSFLTYARTSVFSCASGRRWPTPLDDFQADGINLRTLWTLVDPSFTANTTLAYLMCDKPLPLKRVWSAALLNHLQKFTPSEKTLDYLINLTHIANNPRGLAKGAPYLGYDYNLSHIAKSANVLPDLITGSKNYYPQTTPEKHALSQKLWEPLGLKSDRAATTMSGAGYAKTKAIISESGNTHFGIQDSVSFMQGIAVDNWGYAPVRRRKPQIPKTASPGELAAQLSDFGTNPRVGSKLFNVLWNTNTTKPKLFTRLTKTRLSTMNLHSSRAKPTKINQRIYWQKTTAPLNATDWVFQIFNTVQVDATSNVVKPPKPDIAIKWAKKVLINSTKLSQKAYRFNHKVNEKIGYGVATTYDTVLKAVKNLPEIMRKNVHATSLASAMFRLLVFKEIDEWTNHIKSWYQKHGYKTHKRIFYTFRRILNNVYATAVYSMRVIGLYFQLKGKVNSKGGMRKRTFRAFQGRFGSSTLRTIFQYKFKQVWCKTGAIGLKTIMMHRGTQYVPKYSVSNRVSGHKPKYN